MQESRAEEAGFLARLLVIPAVHTHLASNARLVWTIHGQEAVLDRIAADAVLLLRNGRGAVCSVSKRLCSCPLQYTYSV